MEIELIKGYETTKPKGNRLSGVQNAAEVFEHALVIQIVKTKATEWHLE